MYDLVIDYADRECPTCARSTSTTGWSNEEPSATTHAQLTRARSRCGTSRQPSQATPFRVEVAVDSAGPGGGQTFTYHVPAALGDVEPGEAVLVEYGRRKAIGVVLGVSGGS